MMNLSVKSIRGVITSEKKSITMSLLNLGQKAQQKARIMLGWRFVLACSNPLNIPCSL